MQRRNNNTGFSLAELLIALALLGTITAFTIPKVLSVQTLEKKRTVLKETIASLADITYQASLEGGFTSNAASKAYFKTHLNYVKICETDPGAEGCWVGGDASNADAYLLHNGAALYSINGGTAGESIWIDWDGNAGLNTSGTDRMFVYACTHASNSCSSTIGGTGPKGPGVLGPSSSYASSVTMFEWVFSN